MFWFIFVRKTLKPNTENTVKVTNIKFLLLNISITIWYMLFFNYLLALYYIGNKK